MTYIPPQAIDSKEYLILFITVPIHMLLRYIVLKFIESTNIPQKKMKKIAESLFYLIQYTILFAISLVPVIQGQFWFLRFDKIYMDRIQIFHNNFHITLPQNIYIMAEYTVYISNAIMMFFETRKGLSDFAVMVVHHATTLSLITFALMHSDVHYAVAVAHLHDISDIFLEFSTTTYELGFTKISPVALVLFAVIFIVTRIFIFPVYLIFPFWNGKIEQSVKQIDQNMQKLQIFTKSERLFIPNVLFLLYILQCIWAVFIVRMLYKVFVKGDKRDIRENKCEKKAKKVDKIE